VDTHGAAGAPVTAGRAVKDHDGACTRHPHSGYGQAITHSGYRQAITHSGYRQAITAC